MKTTLGKLWTEGADWPEEPIEIGGNTPEELEERLFSFLESDEALEVIQFDGDFDFAASQRFMSWLAARPVVDVQDDEEFLELEFGQGSYRGPGWDSPYEPTIIINRAVGTDTGRRIGIGRAAYALVRRPDGSYLLFTPQPSRVLVREYWDNNGWGDATRELAVREDGLLEASCSFMEGMADTYGMLPPAESDVQIAQAVIRFNRSNEGGFYMDIVEGKVFHELLDRYLLEDDTPPDDGEVYVEADYSLTPQQRAAARNLLGTGRP